MKKKAILWFVLLCCTISPLVAQKYYSDRENGYSGYATAQYIGTKEEMEKLGLSTATEALERYYIEHGLTLVGPLGKISKEVNFFIWSALNEYKFSDNEIYGVVINQTNSVSIILLVIITNNGKNYQCLDASMWRSK